MIIYKGKKYICHLDLVMDQIRQEWKAVILCQIGNGTNKFTHLHKNLNSISQKVLLSSLKELEAEKFVNRQIINDFPLKTEYQLTDKGKEILTILDCLENWARKNYKAIDME